MDILLMLVTATVIGGMALGLGPPTASAAEPVRLVFDTDMCGDCDDVLALGMIHALQSRGHCRLLAVTVSADHDRAAAFVDAVNTFYGRGDIPIGAVGDGGVVEKSEFLSLVDEKDPGSSSPRYPHAVGTVRAPRSATELLRATLAKQPDRSVAIAQVGFSTNLARLLDSRPDEHSPLTGLELVVRKVKTLSLMAGAFQPVEGNSHYLEYNVVKDIASARALAERWPTEMIYSGFEVGIALPYPAISIERDFGYVRHHPLAEAYIRRNPPPHNRPTWDLTSVLYAVLPYRGYFDLSPRGTVTVESDGFTRFTKTPQGSRRYLILRREQTPRVLEALVQLSSQPPTWTLGSR
jgi:hypothetical protein